MSLFHLDDGELRESYTEEAKHKDKDALLVETNVLARLNYKLLSNHLQHHWAITVICASAALSAIGALLVGLLLKG